MSFRFGPAFHEQTYIPHSYPEQIADLGEISMNYAFTGPEDAPALLLIPGQTESWWGYEAAMRLLADDFRTYAIDLRGQGRSTRTPGRYTLDNMGNDLVRFMQIVIRRPCIVAGLSSGGVLSCWLSAYAPPNLVRGAFYEDAPLFASELTPACGHSIRQGAYSIMFALRASFLGDQWSIGDWHGYVAAATAALPKEMAHFAPTGEVPPQNMKEYDPEWARAFLNGTASAACDHARMLTQVKVPVLFTHHFRAIDPVGDLLMGALSDVQVEEVRRLIEAAGQPFEYHSLPDRGHFLHAEDPALYATTLRTWANHMLS
jgi:pimeloyl-ACP methyl ester carboxylesterase